MKVTKYNKLIRDKIPQIIQASGKNASIEILSNELYKQHLDKKLVEELNEYLDSESSSSIEELNEYLDSGSSSSIEELADLVEIVYAILKYKGTTIEEFETIRKQKNEERGAFERKLLLKEVLEYND